MGLQKAPQALLRLENGTLKNQCPKMGPKKAPQALRWLENNTLKIKILRVEKGIFACSYCAFANP